MSSWTIHKTIDGVTCLNPGGSQCCLHTVSRGTLQASWGMLYFRVKELIDLFKDISLIMPGDIDGLRMVPHCFRCLITFT